MTEERERQIRERKKEMSKKTRRKVLPKVILFFLLLALIIGLSLTVFFKVNKVVVTGESKYSAEEIIKASGVKTGDNLLLINTDIIRTRIEEKYSDIGDISISKKLLSGKLIIKDNGYGSLLCIAYDGKQVIIDSNKKVRRILDKKPDGIVTISGLPIENALLYSEASFKKDEDYETVTELLATLKQSGFKKITSIEMEGTDDITVLYDNRIKLLIGSLSNLDEKLKKAQYIVTEKESEKIKGTLDLTVDNTAYFKEEK